MSQITVVFKDFEEMKEFARELLKEAGKRREPAATTTAPVEAGTAVTPVQPSVQQAPAQQPAPSVQQQAARVQPTAPVQPAVPTQQTLVQTTAPSYKMDDLSNAAMQLMDKGMQAQLLQLISQFGVEALPQLPPEQYGNFATALRGLGAQI